jgi:hypothetical protein
MEIEQKTNGALIGSVIIIIILIIGGIYLWKVSLKERPVPLENTDTSANLETDLNDIDLESLDSEI